MIEGVEGVLHHLVVDSRRVFWHPFLHRSGPGAPATAMLHRRSDAARMYP